MRTVPGVEGDDCVPEAAGGVCNGRCAIGHSIQLVEAAGLKTGWHEQEIGSCCDLVAHGHVEAHPAPCLVGVCVFHPPHAGLRGHTFVRLRSQQKRPCAPEHHWENAMHKISTASAMLA